MGMYLNPGNNSFRRILKSDYIDKTGLITLINNRVDTEHSLICVSRPRRFGKSYAARMLCAYYDSSCDSHDLFNGSAVSDSEEYEDNINKYNVIYLDMSNLLEKVKPEQLTQFIKDSVEAEIFASYPTVEKGMSFDQTLLNTVEITNKKFFVIIDEWDAPIRETPQISIDYLKFLRMLFKGSITTDRIFAAAYMTGILPIKKDGSESAVSDFDECQNMITALIKEYKHIDILVNNAGITRDGLIMKMSEADYDAVLDTNLKGAFNTIRHMSRYFLKQKSGRIINISSVSGILGNAGQANYSASKAGVIGLTKAVARELASRGITVNAVAPGFVETEMTDVLADAAKENLLSQIPLGRPGNTKDIANAVLFLASDAAGYITGQVLSVDGGMAI